MTWFPRSSHVLKPQADNGVTRAQVPGGGQAADCWRVHRQDAVDTR
jgi:hypothetical protein